MTINSLGIYRDKTTLRSPCTSQSFKRSFLPTNHLTKFNNATEGNIISSINKLGKFKKNFDLKSPYLSGDNNVSSFSRVTEKRFLRKKDSDIKSTLPLTASLVYNGSSDGMAENYKKKASKKSVLTLPSDHAPMPQSCTVSDMNDAEYFNRDNDIQKKNKKRVTVKNSRGRGKDLEFYDRDAQYCSQMNIDFDSSSNDNMTKQRACNQITTSNEQNENLHDDVWAVLRNINRFQFDRSTPTTEGSIIITGKKKGHKRRNNVKDMRVFGTCRTEEISYISRYELDSRFHNISNAPYFDRITLIDNRKRNLPNFLKKLESQMVKHKAINNARETQIYNNKTYRNNGKNIYLDKSMMNRSENLKNKLKKSSLFKIGDGDYRKLVNITQNIKNRYATQSQALAREELTYPTYSGSSKGLLCGDRTTNYRYYCNRDSNKTFKGHIPNYFKHHMRGINRIDFNKDIDYNLQYDKYRMFRKKDPREAFTAKICVNTPKLTQWDIRRRLNNTIFPIVILGKDEISDSPFELHNEELPQFNGLDRQIWPYMKKWYASRKIIRDHPIRNQTITANSYTNKRNGTLKVESDKNTFKNIMNLKDKIKWKEKKPPSRAIFNNKTRFNLNRLPAAEVGFQTKELRRPKPMQQIKDRMFKLLHKKPLPQKLDDVSTQSKCVYSVLRQNNFTTINKVETTTYNDDKCRNEITGDVITNSSNQNQSMFEEKRTWCKARWANEFIDNVMRKIRNGVYYSSDHCNKAVKKSHKRGSNDVIFDAKEDLLETITSDTSISKSIQTISKVTITKKCDPLIPIPGFNKTLPELEIKSMNANEITIKHCVTNIIIRFDVTVSAESAVKTNYSSTLIPLTVTQSDTKIFKYETSIPNKMLPAEICTLLPKLMQNLTDTCHQFKSKLTVASIDNKANSDLYSISEKKFKTQQLFNFSLVPSLPISSVMRRFLGGRYDLNTANIIPKLQILEKTLIMKNDKQLVDNLMPHLLRRHFYNYDVAPTISLLVRTQRFNSTTLPGTSYSTNKCLALVPYVKFEIVPVVFQSLPPPENTVYSMNIRPKTINVLNNENCINFTMTYSPHCDIIRINSGNVTIEIPLRTISIGTSYSNTKYDLFTNSKIIAPTKCLEYKDISVNNANNKTLRSHESVKINNKRKKRAKKVLFEHREFKSRDKTTTLRKITSLEKFCKILCGGNILSNIFDADSGHKIMACIEEMKKWTDKIDSNQALLVVLLINKQQTPCSIRYRHLLLQGISVKRITKLNELEMELEVIEKEALNSSSQNEALRYLLASSENRNSLYEELYWIAKTAASDYELPFDESSEKHLKSLLEKRKMLNPSYLRVMARYVGLGLLKPLSKM